MITTLAGALRFDAPVVVPLLELDDPAWRRLLSTADREHVTLAFGFHCRGWLPDFARRRIDANLQANIERHRRARTTYEEIAAELGRAGIPHAVLKGFSHWPCYSDHPSRRPQYDLDVLCDRNDAQRAVAAIRPLGYQPVGGNEDLPVDHLPVLIRKDGWQWRGDFFDVDMPLAVEVHYRLWDRDTERIPIEGLERMWDRRSERWVDDFRFPALDRVDTFGYACLHFTRHLLRGDSRLLHAYELACFLNTTRDDVQFWQRWQRIHSESLRRVEAVALKFAQAWFGCAVPPAVVEEFERFPAAVSRWFDLFAGSPLSARAVPQKAELWLHLQLLHSHRDAAAVIRRRLLPFRLPRTSYAPHTPPGQVTARLRWKRRAFQLCYTASRIAHHLRALPPTAVAGVKWWWARHDLNPQLLRFLGACCLFNFGLTVFFLLYNLLLAQRGFREDLMGAIASAMGIGSIAGTLPSAYIMRHLGLSRTLTLVFAAVPMVCVARAISTSPPALIATAFAGGALFSLYAVSIAPVVAQLTTAESRKLGFSLFFSLGIGMGIIGGFAGGRLPALAASVAGQSASMLVAVLIACAIAVTGAIPISRLRLQDAVVSGQRVYPSSAFVRRFFPALLIWSLATGAFNPFFNVYFSKYLHMTPGLIGTVFSASHVVQVGAILLAPLALRRFGVITGVASMQAATALALASLSFGPAGALAGTLYCVYMGFQYMSEPGLYSLLMDRVDPSERSGAASLNFLVMSGGQALAAIAAGTAVAWYGYSLVLIAASVLGLIAAVLMSRVDSRPAINTHSEPKPLPGESVPA